MSVLASTSHLAKARADAFACLVARASKIGDMALHGPHQVAVTGVFCLVSLSKGGRGEGRGGGTVYDYNVIFGDYGGELGG